MEGEGSWGGGWGVGGEEGRKRSPRGAGRGAAPPKPMLEFRGEHLSAPVGRFKEGEEIKIASLPLARPLLPSAPRPPVRNLGRLRLLRAGRPLLRFNSRPTPCGHAFAYRPAEESRRCRAQPASPLARKRPGWGGVGWGESKRARVRSRSVGRLAPAADGGARSIGHGRRHWLAVDTTMSTAGAGPFSEPREHARRGGLGRREAGGGGPLIAGSRPGHAAGGPMGGLRAE